MKKAIVELLAKGGMAAPKIVYYEETDSTNTRAKEYARAHSSECEPVVFIADSQSAGRGRRGRSFVSEEGAGLYISILFYPALSPERVTEATAYSAVILRRAIAAASGLSPSIKWVNDLYLQGKKLSGILCECEFSENKKNPAIIAGMGINIYKNAITEEIADIATSIEHESELRISREALAARLIEEFLFSLSSLGSDELLTEYRNASLILGKRITVFPVLGEPYEAVATEILDDYTLLATLPDGTKQILNSGEISAKIKS